MTKIRLVLTSAITTVILSVGAWLLLPKPTSPLLPVSPVQFPASQHLGAWLWEPASSFDQAELSQLLDFAHQQQINAIYLTIDSYIDVFELPDSLERTQQLQSYNQSLETFNAAAHERGIQVFALAGNPKWGTSDYHYLPQLLLNFVIDYNSRHPVETQFRGLQYDIETYNLPEFKSDKPTYLNDYLTLVSDLTNRVATTSVQLSLGFTAPYWFDNQNQNLPEIPWQGKTQPVGYHVIDILNQTSGYYVIMAYRDHPDGDNGSISLSQAEIDYAAQHAPKTKILIAQETDDTPEKNISYFGTSKQIFKGVIKSITDHFDTNPVFAGIAIHHLLSFQELPD